MRITQNRFAVCVVLLLALVLPRVYYVETFALPLPFWDQWDSEWLNLIKPWQAGTWRWTDLFAAHNEHRIVPTRLLTLATFTLSGEWNNHLEARVNIPLSILAPAILLFCLFRKGYSDPKSWLVVIVILMGSSMPFSWENFLIGFQSQFYFVNLFTMAALALAAFRTDSNLALIGIPALCLLSVLTVASGLFTPVSVVIIVAAKIFTEQNINIRSAILVLLALAIATAAFLTIPPATAHESLHAANASEFLKTVTRLMGWPLRGSKSFIAVMWLPGIISLFIHLFRRRLAPIDLLFVGCMSWSAMQIVALGYGRGHDFAHMPPRYSEVLLPGLAANAWFVLKLPSLFTQKHSVKMAWLVTAAFFIAVYFSYIQRTVLDMRILKEELARRKTQTENVCQYLRTRNFTYINKPGFQIPYPDPEKLRIMLDDPELTKALKVNCLCP